MKIGNIPFAPIILILVALTSFIMNSIYPGQYGFESQFIRGMFFGAIAVYVIYYCGTWINSAMAVRKKDAAEKI